MTKTISTIIQKAREIQAACTSRATWEELVQIAVEQELHKYDRDPALGELYMKEFFPTVIAEYGSMEKILRHRFGWEETHDSFKKCHIDGKKWEQENYFRPSMDQFHYRVIYNDWPYALPQEMSHFVVWSMIPLLPRRILEGPLKNQLRELGIAGVTGSTQETLDYIDGLYQSIEARNGDSNVDILSRSDIRVPSDKDKLEKDARKEIYTFVCENWPEKDFETIFFINPARVQTVPKLAHFHVLVRPKSAAAGNGSRALTIPENPTIAISVHDDHNHCNGKSNGEIILDN